MKAVLRKIEKKDFKATTGKTFSKVVFNCDVLMEKGEVKSYRGDMNLEYAKEYFAFCGVKTKDLIGQEVEVSLAKRSWTKDNETHITTYIKYLNVLDKDGKAIIMRKNSGVTELDF